MSASARIAQTDYPVEVEDLLAEHVFPLTVTAVAGYAAVASTNSPRALVFAIAAGSGLDAISINLQQLPPSHPPALASWLAAKKGPVVHAIGLAALTVDGVLRVYPKIPIINPAPASCKEIRVGGSLTASAGHECVALHVKHVPALNALFVFGSRGSAAIVIMDGGRLYARPLERNNDASVERPASRIGSMFYSAFRSISSSATMRGSDWETGEGTQKIISSGILSDGVVLIRRCGDVERWSVTGLQWSFNAFDFIGGRDVENSLLGAGVTSDGTVVLLAEIRTTSNQGRSLVCFDVRGDDIPSHIGLVVPVNGGLEEDQSECYMVVSGDIAYFYMGSARTFAWMSVARGVRPDGQVQGTTSIETDMRVLDVVDASFGLPEAELTGGVAAWLHPNGVCLLSSAVPAPMSLDDDQRPSETASVSDAVPVFWRSFLQYSADQRGAAKASLRGMVSFLLSNGFDLEETLSDVVKMVSRKIISSDKDPDKNPTTLLIDTELRKKQGNHKMYLKMLADGEVFSQVRPDAPSIAEDRLWDAVTSSARLCVLTDNEKLATASRIRDIDNLQPHGMYFQRFNDAASRSLISNGQVRGSLRSVPLTANDDIGDDIADVPSVLANALCLAGRSLPLKGSKREGEAVWLYLYPYEFHRFLPALESSMSAALSQLQSDQNMAENDNAIEVPAYRRAVRNIVLLASDAAIAVVQASRDAREENNQLLSHSLSGMNGIGNWLSDFSSCRKMLAAISEKALAVAERMTLAEQVPIRRAATLVVDELLACGSIAAAAREASCRENRPPTPQKRRRLDCSHEESEWGRELRSSLDMLRQSGLNDDAFRLAEKYGDYGTMLSLRVSSPIFDEFMEQGTLKFGDEFVFYAFHWLEERSYLHLLLRGRPQNMEGTRLSSSFGRSQQLNVLLSDYFRNDRKTASNLAWMHSISVGDYDSGTKCLLNQMRKIAQPGKAGSVKNTRLLSSIAKLAILSNDNEEERRSKSTNESLNYVCARLHMAEVQQSIEPEIDSLFHGKDLVYKLVDECDSESATLAAKVVLAVKTIQLGTFIGEKTPDLEDFVWRRCVERQSELWLSMAKHMSRSSDIQLRENLMNTALFKATDSISMSVGEMTDVIDRGAFESSQFAAQGCLAEVTQLVKTAVSLIPV